MFQDPTILSESDIHQLYHFKKEIGSGSFGTVSKAVDKKSGLDKAIKIINKSENTNPKMIK